MRFGRIGLLVTALVSFNTWSVDAEAQRRCNGCASNGTRTGPGSRVGPGDPAPTYGPNGPPMSKEWTHNRPEIWARNSDPIVAERPNRPGKYYDARTQDSRTRGTLGRQTVEEARRRRGCRPARPGRDRR